MPKAFRSHANERIDKIDLDYAALFGRESVNMVTRKLILDRQDRLVSGFKIELPDQTSYPGRIVIHGGAGFARDGQEVFNEDQLDVTRTLSLEGSSTTFYIEIEFLESDSDIDARAFWDATVDQGTDPSGDPKPAGQEFFANVATRKTPDWRVVQPISTTSFQRDQVATVASTRIPLAILRTNGSNEITAAVNPGMSTEYPATTLLEVYSPASVIRVQNTDPFQKGLDAIVSEGEATVETFTIVSVDHEGGLITLAGALINAHNPGDIVRLSGITAPVYIKPASYGRYHRPAVGLANLVDCRDQMYQGDEIHGGILSRGHNGASLTERDDLNLQSLKDYVDFLSAQLQEMKWGVTDPYVSGSSTSRVPPGLASSLPALPRYYDRAGGILGARTAAITVGDSSSSFGDLNGSTNAIIQAAHDALPAAGGRIFLKKGTYSFTADFNITNTGEIVVEGESGTIIELNGGRIHLQTTGSVTLKNLTIREGTATPSNYGIAITTFNPSSFTMIDVTMIDAAFILNSIMPPTTSFTRVYFWGTSANMATIPLMQITGPSGTMSGTFSQCSFYHTTFNALTTSLIDFITGAPTTSCSGLNFVDCEFGTTWLNSESIHLGNTVNIVQFDRCFFFNILTLCHIRATGGAHVKLTNCMGGDNLATFAYFSDMSHVVVDGYLNTNSVGLPAVELVNCNDARITNCDVKVNSGASLVNTAFRISINTDCNTVEVLNNIIHGDTTPGFHKTTGIIVDQTGGVASHYYNVKINGNTFRCCEVPIYVANSGVAASFYDGMEISDNTMVDLSGAGTTTTMKLGILFGSVSTRSGVVISNNEITGLMPATTDVIGVTASRAGICIQGTGNTEFVVEGNVIQYIGHSSNVLANTAGIFIVGISHSTISDNVIKGVYGVDASGIKVSQSITDSTISSNEAYSITATTGVAFGVYIYNLTNTGIVGNQFSSISSAAAVVSGVIGCPSSTAAWGYATITGNNAALSDDLTAFLVLYTASFNRSTITGNTCTGTSRCFMEVMTPAGGAFDNVSVCGNTAHGMIEWAILINASSGTVKSNMSISGNTFHITDVTGDGLILIGISMFSVTGNMVYCASPGYVLHTTDCLRFAVTGNTFARASDLTLNTVKIDTGCNYYTVQGNICDQGGGNATSSIDTASSASQPLGTARVSDNMVDWNTNIGTDIVAAANTAY